MDTIKISVFNVVGSAFCLEAEDGQKVYLLIKRALEEKKKIILSFLNVEMLTTAFLNTAIGQLYKNTSELEIKENISVESITNSGAIALKRVVETAKIFYKDPDAMQRSIDEILGE